MKNNIDYYQHYANADQHPKFKMLRVKFGWSGEGKFWALNNRIAQSENCCLNISKKYIKASIASDLDFNLNEFDEFITYLLNDCELIKECEIGIITTDLIQETFERVSSDRASARERSQRRWKNKKGSSGEEKKSSGEKLSKGKERKVKENIYKKERLGIFEKNNKIPENYKIQKEHIDYALSKGLTEEIAIDQFEYFTDWHGAKGTKYVNWLKCYQTWIRNYLKNNAKKNNGSKINWEGVF